MNKFLSALAALASMTTMFWFHIDPDFSSMEKAGNTQWNFVTQENRFDFLSTSKLVRSIQRSGFLRSPLSTEYGRNHLEVSRRVLR